MLHLLYILAFTIIAFLAVSNLIRSLITLSADSRRYSAVGMSSKSQGRSFERSGSFEHRSVLHPELLDNTGKPVNEPLLVMRSVTVEDAREQLDAIYNSSPSNNTETEEEA